MEHPLVQVGIGIANVEVTAFQIAPACGLQWQVVVFPVVSDVLLLIHSTPQTHWASPFDAIF